MLQRILSKDEVEYVILSIACYPLHDMVSLLTGSAKGQCRTEKKVRRSVGVCVGDMEDVYLIIPVLSSQHHKSPCIYQHRLVGQN